MESFANLRAAAIRAERLSKEAMKESDSFLVKRKEPSASTQTRFGSESQREVIQGQDKHGVKHYPLEAEVEDEAPLI